MKGYKAPSSQETTPVDNTTSTVTTSSSIRYRERRAPLDAALVSHSSSEKASPLPLPIPFLTMKEVCFADQDRKNKNSLKNDLLNTEFLLKSRLNKLEEIRKILYDNQSNYLKQGIVDVLLDVLNSKIEDRIHYQIIDMLVGIITISFADSNAEFCIGVGVQFVRVLHGLLIQNKSNASYGGINENVIEYGIMQLLKRNDILPEVQNDFIREFDTELQERAREIMGDLSYADAIRGAMLVTTLKRRASSSSSNSSLSILTTLAP